MTIQEFQHRFIKDASLLGDYELMSKVELVNGCCDAEEIASMAREEGETELEAKYEALRSAYFSAILLRYWYKIFEWIGNSSSLHLEQSEFVTWLIESVTDAFYYRSWRKVRHDHQAEKKINYSKDIWIDNPQYVEDENAADKSINYFLKAKRGKEYQYYNKDKRKSNVIKYDLDSMIDENGDYAVNYSGAITEAEQDDRVEYLISELVRNKKVIEAIIVDGIANYDTYKEEKVIHKQMEYNRETGEEYEQEYERTNQSFDPRRLVKHLNLINQQFINDFCEVHSVEQAIADETFINLKKLSNTKLYKLIEKTLIEIRTNKDLSKCLE